MQYQNQSFRLPTYTSKMVADRMKETTKKKSKGPPEPEPGPSRSMPYGQNGPFKFIPNKQDTTVHGVVTAANADKVFMTLLMRLLV